MKTSLSIIQKLGFATPELFPKLWMNNSFSNTKFGGFPDDIERVPFLLFLVDDPVSLNFTVLRGRFRNLPGKHISSEVLI